jgi:hypothetical protein
LTYALKLATSRRSLWGPALIMALLQVLPASAAAQWAPGAALALGLTGDVGLAAALLPSWARPGALLALGAAFFVAHARVQAVAIWLSDDRHPPSARAAWSGTARAWRASALLSLGVNGALLAGLAALVVAVRSAPEALASWALLAGAGALVAVRIVARIRLTLAQRGVLLDGRPPSMAWAEARAEVASRRQEVAATWIALAAAGVALWFGGRLVTPALQDTALSFPAGSAAALAREAAQLAVAVPLEGTLIVIALGAWTALHRGIAETPARARDGARDGWLSGALAAVLLLVVAGNGVPTAVERSYEANRRARAAALAARTIEPADVMRSAPPSAAGAPGAPSYEVEAELDDEVLRWTTTIVYTNRTGESLSDLGVNIYPAAFERAVEDIPLARDLIAADASGRLAAELRPGELTIGRPMVNGKPVAYDIEDTALTIALERPLRPGGLVTVELPLKMRLPVFPERFGVWKEVTLLGNFVPVVAQRERGRWRLDPYVGVGDPFFSEAANHRLVIEVDEDLGVVGSGTLVAVEQAPEPGRVRWKFELPAGRDPALAVSRLLRGLETRRAGLTLRAWYAGGDGLAAARALQDAADAAARYSSWFGALPFDEVELLVRAGALGGMEYPGFVTVTDGTPGDVGLGPLPELMRYAGFARAAGRYVVAHEIGHQWWYAAVGNDQVEEPFLDEALAEASARLHLRAEDGDERAWMMTNLRRRAEPLPDVAAMGVDAFASNEAYTEAIYLGGSQALLELRAAIGANAFNEALRAYYESNLGRLATLADLRAAFRRAAPRAPVERYL